MLFVVRGVVCFLFVVICVLYCVSFVVRCGCSLFLVLCLLFVTLCCYVVVIQYVSYRNSVPPVPFFFYFFPLCVVGCLLCVVSVSFVARFVRWLVFVVCFLLSAMRCLLIGIVR